MAMKGPKGRWIVKTPSEANGLGIYMANTMEQIWPNLTRSLLSHPEDKEALVVSRSVVNSNKGCAYKYKFRKRGGEGGVYWGWLIYHSFFCIGNFSHNQIHSLYSFQFIFMQLQFSPSFFCKNYHMYSKCYWGWHKF